MNRLKINSENRQNEMLSLAVNQEPKRNRWNNRRRYFFLTQYKFI